MVRKEREDSEERRENGSEDKDKGTRETTVDFEPRPDCLQAILSNQQVLEVDCELAITTSSDLCCSPVL